MRFRAGFAEAIAVGLLAASAATVVLSVASNAYAAEYALDPKSVSRGQTTAVLIRFEAVFNGQPRKVYGTLFQPMPYLANMDRGEAPVRVPLTTAYRVKGADDGWIAWGLQPGTYFLLVRPTGWPGTPPSSYYDPVRNTYRLVTRDGDVAGSAEMPGFWFVVPPTTPALYLGTVTMDCRGKENYFIVNADLLQRAGGEAGAGACRRAHCRAACPASPRQCRRSSPATVLAARCRRSRPRLRPWSSRSRLPAASRARSTRRMAVCRSCWPSAPTQVP